MLQLLRISAAIALLSAYVACEATASGEDAGSTEVTPPRCESWADPSPTGLVTDTGLDELSGLAVSSRHAETLWVHNDSVDGARFYALDTTGRRRASWRLEGHTSVDWEDVAIGPCAAGDDGDAIRCLWFADTGDNDLVRTTFGVVRVYEPTAVPDDGSEAGLGANLFTSWTLPWPDGPRNAEAIAVLPDARLILLTKEDDGWPEVWRVDPDAPAQTRIERLGALDLTRGGKDDGREVKATAADLDPDGRHLVVRTYERVWLFDLGDALLGPAGDAASVLESAEGQRLDAGVDEQGEALGWDAEGGFWHTSERSDGVDPKIWRVGCAP